MLTTGVFAEGDRQFVLIPEQFQTDAEELYVSKPGSVLILTANRASSESFEKGADLFSDVSNRMNV